MVPKADISFTEKVLRAFKRISSEITIESLEHDFSPRLGRFFCEEVLGFDSNLIRYEQGFVVAESFRNICRSHRNQDRQG